MAQFLRDLLLNGYNGVKPIETIQKGNNLGQQVKDVVSAELSKTGKRVLFYKQLPTLYGSDLVRISTKGSVDPARTLSVATSRYVDIGKNRPTLGKLIGNLLGGSAGRPSDTIFPANDQGQGIAIAPPVSINGQPINGDYSGLKYAVEAGQNYAVSQEPAGKNALTGLLKGSPSDIARNTIGAATGAVKNAVKNVAINALASKRKTAIGNLSNKLKNSNNLNTSIRVPNTKEKPGSKFIKVKNVLGLPELIDVEKLKLKERNYLIEKSKNGLLNTRTYDIETLNTLVKENTGNDLQFIKIKVEDTFQYLLFPAAISGDISDNMTPEWNAFKYVGSPFNTYRYNGVERKISFDFRVYWINNGQQVVMRDKLNLLRQLAYPSTNLTTIKLNDSNPYKPTVFTPNTIQLSIGNLYKNLKGFVSNLSISVPQETPWASSNPTFLPANSNIVYPHYVDVSFEMTIIENHSISNEDDTITYRFDSAPEVEPKPATMALPTQPASSIKTADIPGPNKPQTQIDREARRQADFANSMNVADIGPGGVPGKVAGVVRWDANL
jgi:hypothetical protein